MRRDPNASRPTAVNFLPEWYRRRRRGRRIVRCQVIALLGLLVLFAWLIGQQLHQRTELNRRHARILEQLQSVRQQSADMDQLRRTHQEVVQSLRVQHRLHRPVGYAEIAATLVDLVPEPVTLRRLRMEVGQRTVRVEPDDSENDAGNDGERGDAPEQRTRPIVTIHIEGIGPSDTPVSQFTGALASHALFRNVEIGYWRQAEYQGLRARRFAVRTTVPLDRRYQPPADPDAPDRDRDQDRGRKPTEMTHAR